MKNTHSPEQSYFAEKLHRKQQNQQKKIKNLIYVQNENPQKVKVTSSWLHSLSCLSAAISLSVATLTSPRLFKLSLLPSLPSLLLSHSTPPLLPYPPLSPGPPSDVQRSFNKISRTLSVYYCGTIKGCRAPWVPYMSSECVCVCVCC